MEAAVDHRPGARGCTGLWSSVSGVGTGTRKANVEAKLGWGFPEKQGSGIEVLGKLGKRGREDRRRLRESQSRRSRVAEGQV